MSRKNEGVQGYLAGLLLSDDNTVKLSKSVVTAGATLGAVGLVAGACFWLRKKTNNKAKQVDPVVEFMREYQALSPEQQLRVAHDVLSQQVGGTAGAASCALVGAKEVRGQTFFVAPLPDSTAASIEFDLTNIDPAYPYVAAIAHERVQPNSVQLMAACARMMRQQQAGRAAREPADNGGYLGVQIVADEVAVPQRGDAIGVVSEHAEALETMGAYKFLAALK